MYKIKSIKKIQNKSKRYDIGVDINHNFYANDILVHNCQNLSNEIQEAIDNEDMFEITIKLDGSSMSVGKNDDEFAVCSRNINLEENDTNSFWRVANKHNLFEKFKEVKNIMISGELMGPGIQKNREKLKEHEMFVFDILDVDNRKYFGTEKRLEIVNKLGLQHVPILHKSVTLKSLGLNSIDDILEFADGKSLNAEIREGVVFKRIDGGFSFKSISNKFLLKYD